tara:strand:+ start:69 stop:620 length:552 start_codon:yes stop_codon:yes gene_type:complete
MYNIFSSYIHEEFFEFNTKQLKKDILKIKSKDKGRNVSNYGGWQSNSFVSAEKPFDNLFDKINFIVKDIKNQLHLNKELALTNFWCNINKFGSFNRPHDHLGAIVSGVYYINTPKNCGKICFTQQNLDVFYKNLSEFNEYNSSTWEFKPKENLCLLFPSYLTHYVEPNLNKEERISISFNYGF